MLLGMSIVDNELRVGKFQGFVDRYTAAVLEVHISGSSSSAVPLYSVGQHGKGTDLNP